MTSKTDHRDPDPETAAREALQTLGDVLATKPEKDDHALSAATQKLAVYREALIAAARGGGAEARTRLDHLNAVLSVVTAMHFPSGDVPWAELEKARGWLRDLLTPASAPAAPQPG
jgi:hypothetical protein